MAPSPLLNSVQILCSSQKAFCDLRVSFHCLTACVLILVLCFPSVPKCFKLPDALNHHSSLLSLGTLFCLIKMSLPNWFLVHSRCSSRVENQEFSFGHAKYTVYLLDIQMEMSGCLDAQNSNGSGLENKSIWTLALSLLIIFPSPLLGNSNNKISWSID